MTNEPAKEDPVERFRKLLRSLSPLTRLPKKERDKKTDATQKMDSSVKELPVKKTSASQTAPEPGPASRSGSTLFGPRLWTIASILSLAGNLILLLVLAVLLIGFNRTGLSVSYLLGLGNSAMELPGGLYENFEKMDAASIRTNVQVDTTIPVQFDLQLDRETTVVLTQDVAINNALVTVNTGGLNITRANTTIVLPQGTSLPVFLSLTVPVDTQVEVTLDVPVDIPLSQTELHEPFVGLQDVIKPLYCALNPNAVNLAGRPVCP
ncbi:MAG TPA: hypothetical protein PLF42_10720 [Anaerolineales bacterium]|nr:hypothetical protein [Anaerolineales bacterium]